MAKSPHQNQKLLRLQQIFLQETDEDHGLTMQELTDRLQSFGIAAERKSIYENIETLNQCGMDILRERQGKETRYYAASRTFDPAELQLLADAVASSRFITAKKSDQLVQKLAALASAHQGGALKRQVQVADRIKNMNETIFYLVDDLSRAIRENAAITFRYYDWVLEGRALQKKPRHGGARYTVSPWKLLWEDEFYYLIAFDHATQTIRHYRVDRMGDLAQTDQKRLGEAAFKAIRMEGYTARLFGMFGGEPRRVTLTFPARYLGAMIDRFGKTFTPERVDEDALQIRVEVIPSRHFFGWLFALGEEVQLTAPEDLQTEFNEQLKRRLQHG